MHKKNAEVLQDEVLDSYRPQIKEFSNEGFKITMINLLKETMTL